MQTGKGKNKKTAVVGIKDQKTGAVRAIPVPETTAARLLASIEANVGPNSKKFTDENRAYNVKKDTKHILIAIKDYSPISKGEVILRPPTILVGSTGVRRPTPPH